jgi:hypothetical protein
MRPVAVIGIGKTPFGAFPGRDLRSLAVEAGEKSLKNGHAAPAQVDAFFLGNFAGPSFVGQNHLAPYVSRALGILGRAVHARGGGLRFERIGPVPRLEAIGHHALQHWLSRDAGRRFGPVASGDAG